MIGTTNHPDHHDDQVIGKLSIKVLYCIMYRPHYKIKVQVRKKRVRVRNRGNIEG